MWILIRWLPKKKKSIGLSKRFPQQPSPHLEKNKNTHKHTPAHTDTHNNLHPSLSAPLPLSGKGLAACPACIWWAFVWGLTRRAYGRCPSAHSSSPPPGALQGLCKCSVPSIWPSCLWVTQALFCLFVCSFRDWFCFTEINEILF